MLTHNQNWRSSKAIKRFVQCGLILTVLFLFSALCTASHALPFFDSNSGKGQMDVSTQIQSSSSVQVAQSYPYGDMVSSRLRRNSDATGPTVQSPGKRSNDLILHIDMGYQAVYKMSYWTPVHVSILNNGADFTGKLTINVFTGPLRSDIVSIVSPWDFEQPVSIRHGAQKQVTVYSPFVLGNLIPMGYIATLHDTHGQIAVAQTVARGYNVRTGDLFIGVLSDLTLDSFNALANVVLPHQANSLTLSQLDASTMPDNTAVLKVFDILIFDNFDTSTLSSQQLTALQTWVNQGGVLIEIGGQDWQRTVSKLPNELLAVKTDGARTLAAGTTLLPTDSILIAAAAGQTLSGTTLPTAIPASTGQIQNALSNSKTLLAAGTTPLVVQSNQGQGAICYLAFDLASSPLASWDGTGILWKTILLNALGDRVLISSETAISYDIGPAQLLTQGGIVDMVLPGRLLEPGLVLLLLFSYVLMLGPIRILIMRRWKLKRMWTWRIIGLAIVGFSLLDYSLALYQKNALLTDNTLSLVQLTQSGSAAHIMTYHGIFVPNQGNITLSVPGGSLALPLSSPQLLKSPLPGPKEDPSASIVAGEHNTTVTLPNTNRWTFHPVVSEQDTHLQGALTPHLTLHNNRLVGTISNTLSATLNDVYILLPHAFVTIGHIGAGETQQIDLPIHDAPFTKGKGLADFIAAEGGLPASYFPYTPNGAQTLSDFQRHMALLSALNGAGVNMLPCNGPCNHNALTLQNSIVLTSSSPATASLSTTFDPLLIAGAAATLIGWTEQSLNGMDAITLNGAHPGGRHESFVRMPLNIAPRSVSDIPGDFVTGEPLDVQNSRAELIEPGVYSLSETSLFFAFNLPEVTKVQAGNLTIKTPLQNDSTGGQNANAMMQTHIYNWQTGKWDMLAQAQGSLTITNPSVYISKGEQAGRILLQIINPHHAPTPLIFGKPSLIFSQ